MSGTLTPYGRDLLLSSVFTPDIAVLPTHLWLAYTRQMPVANSDGSQLDEPTTGYARADLGTLDSSHWAFTGFNEVYNLLVITFPTATADWGLMQGWAILDISTLGAGNCVAVGPITEPFQVANGEAPSIDVAGLAVGLYD